MISTQKIASFIFATLFVMLFAAASFAASLPPKGYPTPIALRQMNGGFWRADHTFSPILYITNLLVTNSLQVTPVLYMADGTEYDLAPVTVTAGGVTRVSIADALRVAPAKIQPHVSEFGSVGLRYEWHWQNAVSAIVQNLDTTRSLNFNYPVHTAMKMAKMPPKIVHKEGLWWKEEPNVEASVNLVNVSTHPVSVHVEVLSSLNQVRDSERAVVSPNSTAQLEIALPEDQRAGGVRVSYHGMDRDIIVTGGLEDAGVGYSAKIPFTSMVKEKVSDLAVSSVGLMVGQPDPMMGFPRGTKFGVYSAFRNTSNRTISVTPTLYYMAGTSNKLLPLRAINLAPGESRYLSPQEFQQVSGLGAFSGMANLVFSYQGKSGEIILANGSIDNTKTYVFESELNGVGKSESKGLTAWNLADGNNTMISLLNTSKQDEDLIVTLYHSQGKYRMPVHLKAGASTMFNISDLIMMRTPDIDGKLLPMDATSGSAVVSGKDSDADWIEVAVGIGIFNVTTATCGTMCPTCYGYSDFLVQGDSPNTAVGGTASFSSWGLGQNGTWQRVNATWSSSNGNVASSQGLGSYTGGAAGSFSALANGSLIDENADCPEGSGHPCPTSFYDGSGPGNVATVTVTDADLENNNVNVTLAGGSGLSGTLVITVNGISNTYQVSANGGAAEAPGSYSVSLVRTSMPADTYRSVTAEWNVGGGGPFSGSLTLARTWWVLGLIRHSQYNVPYESACTGTPETAWLYNSSCQFTQVSLKSDFVTQAQLNGTGSSLSNGIVKYNDGACQNYPAGANSSNSLRSVSSITGACGALIAGDSVATTPNPAIAGNPYVCGDNILLVNSGNANQAIKHVADNCPACSTGFNGTNGHIDDYSSSQLCSGHSVGDYGNFWTADTR